MELRYTPAAREDLAELHDYISEELHNPTAARSLTTHILKDCGRLKDFPLSGGDLAAKTGRDTDLRYLVCGKYLAFYRVQKNHVSVIRILSGRSNYLQVLFDTED